MPFFIALSGFQKTIVVCNRRTFETASSLSNHSNARSTIDLEQSNSTVLQLLQSYKDECKKSQKCFWSFHAAGLIVSGRRPDEMQIGSRWKEMPNHSLNLSKIQPVNTALNKCCPRTAKRVLFSIWGANMKMQESLSEGLRRWPTEWIHSGFERVFSKAKYLFCTA